MGRAPCCEKVGLKKGPWTPEEDQILISYVEQFGHGNWRILPKQAGLLRCGKSCRLRWINYLRPDIKRGNFTAEEEETIIRLHGALGNRWSAIAAKLPGRTDNEIKNVWNTHLRKRAVNHTSSNTSETQQLSQSSKKEPESESECDASSVATSTTTAMASEDTNKDDHARKRSPVIKNGNADDSTLDSELNEDFWAQVCSSESVLPMAAGGGFEPLSPYNLPTPTPLFDYSAINGLGEVDDTEQYFWDNVKF